MTSLPNISGAKAGGGSFKQTPDNLRSNDTFEGLLGICAGPVVGPTRGLKSITIDGTPIEDESGQSNFQDFTALVADGDPAKHPQMVKMQLGGGGSPINVGLSLSNTNPAGTPGPWVSKTVPNTGADALDLRIIVQQLYRQDKNGVYGTTANIEIEMKPTGSSTWINPVLDDPSGTYNENGWPVSIAGTLVLALFPQKFFDANGNWISNGSSYFAITGKTTSPYVWELRIVVPNEGAYAGKGWDIRARLVDPENVDADPNFEKRTISWESISAVYSDPIGGTEAWRGVSWLYLKGKASDQLTNVPDIGGPWDTKIVSVPPSTVFDPATRTYTGTLWDGSYAKAFTRDPAWIINDAISDGLFGVSYVAPGSYLNKWDALDASKWFSELVPDGKGGTHPRYSLDLKVDQAQKADELIQYMAGAVGAIAWDTGNGEWRMRVDRAERPSDIFTLENIEGDFHYTHTDIDTRYNDITMSFLNEEFDYREDRVRVWDQTHIDTYGRKPTTLVAVGCTNRQEAFRRAMLRLRSSINEWRNVNFVTNRRGRIIRPLDTILVADVGLGYKLPTGIGSANPADADSTDNRTTGRMVAYDAATKKITVRDTIRLEIGVNYTLTYASPGISYTVNGPDSQAPDRDKPMVTTTVNIVNSSAQRGDVRDLYIDAALPSDIPEYAVVAISAAGLPSMPKAYRVLSVQPNDDGERVTISAIEIDSGKWAAADNVDPAAIALQVPNKTTPAPLPPGNGDILTPMLIPTDTPVTKRVLSISWARPSSLFITGFKVTYRLNDGPEVVLTEKVQDTNFIFEDPYYGSYVFYIYALDRRGQISAPLTSTIDLDPTDFEIAFGDGYLKEYPGGPTAQWEDFKTDQGTAAGIANQGPWATEQSVTPALVATRFEDLDDILVRTDALETEFGAFPNAASMQAAIDQIDAVGGLTAARDSAIAASNLSASVAAALYPRTPLASALTNIYLTSAITPFPDAAIVDGVLTDTAGQNGWGYGLFCAKTVPVVANSTTRLTAKLKTASASPDNWAVFYVVTYKADGSLRDTATIGNPVLLTTSYQELTADFTHLPGVNLQTDGATLRFGILYNRDNTLGAIAATTSLTALYLDDATLAKATSDDRQLAQTAKTDAGTYANTARQHRDDAQTAQSHAETAETNANTAYENATGAAALASASQKLAASIVGNDSFDPILQLEGWASNVEGTADVTIGSVYSAYEGRSYYIVPAGMTSTIFSRKRYPVDPNRRYRMKTRIGAYNGANPSASPARFYVGFAAYDGSGNPIEPGVGGYGGYGTFRYACVNGVLIGHTGLPVEYSEIITGSGNDDWKKFPPGTASIAPMAILNLNDTPLGVPTDLNTYLDGITFDDVEDLKQTENSATIASEASAAADIAKAAAQASATLSAQVSVAAINKSPTFQDNVNETGAPTNWTGDQSGASTITRIPGPNGFGYSIQFPGAADNQAYIAVLDSRPKILSTNGYYVIEADITLTSGSLSGAGVLFRTLQADGSILQDHQLRFFETPDESGTAPGGGVVGKTYRFRKLVQTLGATLDHYFLYAMSHWAGLGDISVANNIAWQRCAVRPATQTEIDVGLPAEGLAAQVKLMQGAIASVAGKTSAYWQVETNAGAGTEAFASLQSTASEPSQAPLTIFRNTDMLVMGRDISRLASSGWNSPVFSKETYTGSAYLSYQPKTAGMNSIVGLSSVGPGKVTAVDGAFWVCGDGNTYIRESDNLVQTIGPTKPTDVYAIAYTGTNFAYYVNGRNVRNTTVTAGMTWWLDGAIFETGSGIKNVIFGASPPSRASTIAFGADEFHIYNQAKVGTNKWEKALSVIDGVVYMHSVIANEAQLGSVIINDARIGSLNGTKLDGLSVATGKMADNSITGAYGNQLGTTRSMYTTGWESLQGGVAVYPYSAASWFLVLVSIQGYALTSGSPPTSAPFNVRVTNTNILEQAYALGNSSMTFIGVTSTNLAAGTSIDIEVQNTNTGNFTTVTKSTLVALELKK